MFSSVDLTGLLFGRSAQNAQNPNEVTSMIAEEEANIQVTQIYPRRNRRPLPLSLEEQPHTIPMLLDDDPEAPAAGTRRRRQNANPYEAEFEVALTEWPGRNRNNINNLYQDLMLLDPYDGVRAEYFALFNDQSRRAVAAYLVDNYDSYATTSQGNYIDMAMEQNFITREWLLARRAVQIAVFSGLWAFEDAAMAAMDAVIPPAMRLADRVEYETGIPLGSGIRKAVEIADREMVEDPVEFDGLQAADALIKSLMPEYPNYIQNMKDWEYYALWGAKLSRRHRKLRRKSTLYAGIQGVAFDYYTGIPYYQYATAIDKFLKTVYPYLPDDLQDYVSFAYVVVDLAVDNTIKDLQWRKSFEERMSRKQRQAYNFLWHIMNEYDVDYKYTETVKVTEHFRQEIRDFFTLVDNPLDVHAWEIKVVRDFMWKQLKYAEYQVYLKSPEGQREERQRKNGAIQRRIRETQMIGDLRLDMHNLPDAEFLLEMSGFLHTFNHATDIYRMWDFFDEEAKKAFEELTVTVPRGPDPMDAFRQPPAVLVVGIDRVYMTQGLFEPGDTEVSILRTLYAAAVEDAISKSLM